MSLIDELKQAMYGLPLKPEKLRREKLAHFCEHRGICIVFTPARTLWQANAPSTLRPWWIELETLRKEKTTRQTDRINTQKEEEIEVLENA